MLRHWLSPIIVGALFGCTAALAEDSPPTDAATPDSQAGAEVLARLKTAAESHETIQYTIQQDITVLGQHMPATGHVQAARNGMNMRMEIRLPNGVPMEQHTIVSGDTLWSYMPLMNVATKIDLARVRPEVPDLPMDRFNNPQGFVHLLDEAGLEYVGSEEHSGVPCERFRLNADAAGLLPGGQTPPGFGGAATDMWIGAADGIPRELQVTSPNGTPMLVQRFTEIELNAPLSPDAFDFTPPEGTQVMDMTEMAVQLWKAGGMPGAMMPGSAGAALPPAAPAPQASHPVSP